MIRPARPTLAEVPLADLSLAEARAFLEPIAARIEAVAGERHPATRSVRRFLGTLAAAPGADP